MNYYTQLLILESLILKYNSTHATTIKEIISNDKDLERTFFEIVNTTDWFQWIKDSKYFDPNTIQFDGNGNALFWSVLNYLDRISGQVAQNIQYGKDLIEIVNNVVQYSQNKKRVNNYHIWWYCVKILNNLPIEIINRHLSIEKLCSWLSVWIDNSMGPITDISERLLPKFLNDDSTLEYAETILNAITQIKAGGKVNAFINREEATFVWDYYWIRDAFRKNSQLIGHKCSSKVILDLADKLKKALEYKLRQADTNIEIGQDIYQVAVSRIPVEGTKPKEIDFKDGQYECSAKLYSSDQLKDLERHNAYPGLINTDPQIQLTRFTLSAVNRNDMASAIKQNLPAEINWTGNANIIEKIEYLYDGLFSDYSYIRIKSLATGTRDYERGVEEVLTIILRDTLLAKCESNRVDGREILAAFLSDQYKFPVFRRLALLCVDKFWTDYSGLMDRFFGLYPNALAKRDFEVEMYDVLRNHNSDFAPAFRAKLKQLVNTAPEYTVEEDDKHIAHLQCLWLSPLRDNPEFSVLYEEAMQKAGLKDRTPYEPDRSSDFKVVDVVHKSPLSKEDILQQPIIETVNILKEFKGTDFWHRTLEGEFDKEGLANTLQSAVRENPKIFTDELSAFLEVDDFYIRCLLRGIKEAWNDNKEIDWGIIFDYSAAYLKRAADLIIKPLSLDQKKGDGQWESLWVFGDIVELVSEGCRDDKHAFDPKHFEKVEHLFDLILALYKEDKRLYNKKDALAYAWNTTLGRTIMAYVSFSLRVARATKSKPVNWGKHKFERFFNKGIEACTLFGSYLPQIKYLDENYTIDKIELFSKASHTDSEWKMFMEGYLSDTRVYKDVYGLMRDNYSKGLEHNVFEKHIDQRLVDHICIGYLYFDELLNDKNNNGKESLFWKMLTSAGVLGKRERWMEVINVFWANTGRTIRKQDTANKDEISDTITKKVIEFWAWTYNQPGVAKSNLEDDYNAFLGQLAELTILFDKIDEDKEKWLLLCAPHVDRHHKANFFIQYLTKFDDEESIKRIGKIFLKVLENTTPMFKQEDIGIIVGRIYEKGDRNDADTICNIYGRQGLHFLKPVWEEHQKVLRL